MAFDSLSRRIDRVVIRAGGLPCETCRVWGWTVVLEAAQDPPPDRCPQCDRRIHSKIVDQHLWDAV